MERRRELVHAGAFEALEGALWRELAQVRDAEPLAPVAVLVPTNLLRRHLTAQAARHGGCINVHFLTLLDLARRVGEPGLAAEGWTPLPPFAEEVLAAAVCREGDGGYFATLADLPGFQRALLATIDDLKQAGHEPDDLARAADALPAPHRWLAPKLRDLHALWAAFAGRLASLRLYQPTDLLAAAASAAPTNAWLARVPAVFIYGFYDLNELQRRLVAAAADGRGAVTFFPYQEGAEAFAYAEATFAWFVEQGFAPRTEPEPPVPGELARLRAGLFGPASGTAHAAGKRLAVLSAPDEVREVHAVLRSALDGARAGTRLTRVGVLLHRVDTYGGLFAEECAAGGLAAYQHDPPPLSSTRAGRSLLMVLRLLGGDLARADVMDFITYADIPFESILPEGREAAPADWDLLSIEAGVVKGADAWPRQLRVLRRRLEAEREWGDGRAVDRLAALAAFETFLADLFGALGSVPADGEWGAVVGAVLDVYRRFVRPSDERMQVEEAVSELMRLDATGEPADAATLERLAREALDARRCRETSFGSAGPVVVDLMEGRGLPFDVVFVPGMVEKGFPVMAPTDPLLSDRERRLVNAAGLRLPLKRERAKEEQLLFRLAVGAARERVVLSFPRLDPSSGRERVPSHYLLRAVEAVTGKRCAYGDLAAFAGFERLGGPAFAPGDPADAWREAEYDLAAIQGAVAARSGAEAAYLTALAPTFASALRAEASRWGERRFTEYDGVLSSEAALAALASKLGPMPWDVSATALERYAACPFRYFLERVLEVAPLDEPETVTRLSALDRGSLLHDILYHALRRAREEGWLPLRREHDEQVLATAGEDFARLEAEGRAGVPALWAVERAGLEMELRRFVLDEAAEGTGYVPAHLEVCFGQRPRHGEGDLGSREGVLFALGDGRSVRLRGRIDRIDVRPEDGAARVLDYKTGSVPQALKADSFSGGTALQLPLYLRAAQELLGDEATVELAAYRYVTERGGYRTIAFTRDALDERGAELLAILDTIASGIASGRFFAGVAAGGCRHCDYKGVCGVLAEAAARFKTDDEAFRDYRTMQEIE